MTAVLETRGLERRFVTAKPLIGPATEVRAVDGVDLAIAHGETFAIVGESGCGKSTLARLLVRLIDPSAGEVLYRDRDISRLGAEEMRTLRRDLQFIFQDPFSSLNPRMTIGALIDEPTADRGAEVSIYAGAYDPTANYDDAQPVTTATIALGVVRERPRRCAGAATEGGGAPRSGRAGAALRRPLPA